MLIRLMYLKRKLFRNFYDYGFRVCFKKVVFYIFGAFYKNEIQIIYGIDINKRNKKSINCNHYVFKMVKPEDSALITQIEKMEEWLEDNLKSKPLSNGKCFAFLEKTRLIGFYLVSFNDVIIPKLKLKVNMKHHEAWGEQITIHREFRGKGLSTDLKQKTYYELTNIGIKTIYGHVEPYNIASLKTVVKFYLKKAYKVKYLSILNSNKIIFKEIPINRNDQNIFTLLSYLNDNNALIPKIILTKQNRYGFIPVKNRYFFTIKILEGILTSSQTSNKREYARKIYKETIHFTMKDRNYAGISENISSGGIFIKTNDSFLAGQVIILNIPFTNKQRHITVPAEIVRLMPEGIGIKFLTKIARSHILGLSEISVS